MCRGLTIEGKIVIFRSLAVPNILHLALIKTVSIFTVKHLNIFFLKNFNWQGKKPKIKHSTKAKHTCGQVILLWRCYKTLYPMQ